MIENELRTFKKTLEAKRTELERLLRNREAIAIDKSPDTFDELQYATEREMAIRKLDRESNLLRNVRGALRRFEEGGFGVCRQCEQDISPKRLEAVPWTPFCIRCQEMADRTQQGVGSESFEEPLVNAA